MSNKKIQFNSADLQEQSTGLRFDIPQLGEHATGFAIRYKNQVYAYVNQCAHMPVELDWNEGEFFSVDRNFLICATHGAHYEPNTGHCVYGPCKGKQLHALSVTEENEQIIIHLEKD